MKWLENLLDYTTVFRLLAIAWITACILFVVASIAFPQSMLLIIGIVFCVFCIASIVFAYTHQDTDSSLRVLKSFFFILLGADTDELAAKLSANQQRKLAFHLTDSLTLLSIGGIVISSAFFLLVFLNVSTQNPTQTSISVLPTVAPITPAAALSQGVGGTPTPLPMVTLMPVPVQIIEAPTATPVPVPTLTPRISMEINWAISSTVPTPGLAPQILAVEEYKKIINVLAPRVVIADVVLPDKLHSQEEDEFVVLVNHGDPIDLSGWYIVDSLGNRYLFEDLSLGSGRALYLHTGLGENNQFHLYWNYPQPIWVEDLVLTLYTRSNIVVDRWKLNTTIQSVATQEYSE